MRPSPSLVRIPGRQHGATFLLVALLLVFMVAMVGLAVDGARLFNRKAELQSLTDVVALASAERLNGTAAGIDAALQAAETTAGLQRLRYGHGQVAWSGAALRFGVSPTGPWLEATAARATPKNMLFVKVDSDDLPEATGTLETIFMGAVSPASASTSTSASAVAGRSAIRAGPLAVCALSNTEASKRSTCFCTELVQYGFRRGVGYDLMQLSPITAAPASFVLNPIDAIGRPVGANNTSAEVAGPFACTGSMPRTTLVGEIVPLARPFPLGQLYRQLNSRFGQYDGGLCEAHTAPPDSNIAHFDVAASARWMQSDVPGQQGAKMLVEPNKRWTVADPLPSPVDTKTPDMGVLWSFAKPVPYTEWVNSHEEPESGYKPFPKIDWPGLYIPAAPTPSSEPIDPTPYDNPAWQEAPDATLGAGVRGRRVLNVPLLNCPAGAMPSSYARVLAIGRFFMTTPATPSSIPTEFAGIAQEKDLLGNVELYR